MAKYEIEFEQYIKVVVEAESRKQAEDIAAIMDDEEIKKGEASDFLVFDITQI